MVGTTAANNEKDDLLLNRHGDTINGGTVKPAEKTASSHDTGMDYEEAVSHVGYGCFNYLLLLLCGWTVSSDAIEVLSISFILPAAACDLQLDDAEDGLLTSVVFGGMMVGGYAWGILADRYGRRKILIYSLFMGSLCSAMSTVSQQKAEFIFWSFWAGVGTGGSLPVVFTYFAEFQTRQRRGKMICVLAAFWMCGNIFAAGVAWAMITTAMGYFASTFTYDSWRIYLAVCSIPALTGAIAFIFLPESPKFLISAGYEHEALRVLQLMYKRNHNGQKHHDCPITKVRVDHEDHFGRKIKDEFTGCCFCCLSCCYTIAEGLRRVGLVTMQLFQKPYTKASVILTFINFTLNYGYFGLYTWFPELFEQLSLHPGPVCEVSSLINSGGNATTTNSCDSKVPSTTYFYAFLTAFALFPGNIVSALCIERVGRKPLIVGSMFISGVSVFFIALVDSTATCVAMSCAFGGILVASFGALDVLTLELYPTYLRSAVFGFQLSVGKLAGIAATMTFAELVATSCFVPMFMVAILLAAGGLATLTLPKTTNTDLM